MSLHARNNCKPRIGNGLFMLIRLHDGTVRGTILRRSDGKTFVIMLPGDILILRGSLKNFPQTLLNEILFTFTFATRSESWTMIFKPYLATLTFQEFQENFQNSILLQFNR